MRSHPKMSTCWLAIIAILVSGAARAQISGHLTVCRGASRTVLTGTPSGGTWSSGDVARATINASTGEVTGVAAGTATISYTAPTSAVYTAVVTVNSYVMSAIGFSMGSDVRCTGGATSTCTVSPVIGNNWTTSNASIATINTSGIVTPSATNVGTVTISYRHGYGNCYVTRNMTVTPTPTVSISTPMCAGTTQTATATPAGGTWMSTSPAVGTINTTTGVLSALIGGGTGIRYTVGTCLSQPYLTVAAPPAAISGVTTICVGNSSTLSSGTSGGTWSSSNPSVATIGSSTGVVSGLSTGTTTISYIVGSGCFRTAVVTVNTAPSLIAGPDEVCVGQSIVLTNATGGGSWASSNTLRATVTIYGGTVVGVAAGTVNISYRIGGGCATLKTITVNATMASITGGPSVCEGASVSLSHSMSGGTWAASNTHATIDGTTGVMTGVTAGAVNITYTASPGCVKVQMMTVKSAPAAITGVLTVCSGATTALSSASGGGTWTSSNASVATVSSTGVVTGVSGGTATITYTVASWGCSTTAVVTVSSTGTGITGTTTLCDGSGTTLSCSPGGGTWSSSNTAVATIGSSSGVVAAVGAGTTSITYSVGGCASTIALTVGAMPGAVSGATALCTGTTSTLTNALGGGVWTSSNTSVATIGSSSGIVTPGSVGTSVITYTTGAGCVATAVVTVTTAPGAIGGPATLCAGSSITLTNSASGGSWTSSNISVATVGSLTGIVTGVAAGSTQISYHVGSCASTLAVSVASPVASISGTTALGIGDGSTFSCTTTGGTWSSSNSLIAVIDSSTGVLTALTAGTTVVSYMVSSSCYSTVVVMVSDTVALTLATVAGNGTTSYAGDGGPATGTGLSQPGGIAFDAAGNMYVSSFSHNYIRKVTPSGAISTVAGTGTASSTGDGGPATAASLNNPLKLLVDGSGNIYVSELNGHRVRKISTSGIITTVAGTGTSGSSADGVLATAALLNQPSGLAMDASGNLYISDYSNNKVRKVSVGGVMTTFAGTGASTSGGDGGAATSAGMLQPWGLTFDAAGNLYVGQPSANKIRRINTSGIIETVAGTGSSGFSGDGGPATLAKFNNCTDIALDGTGNLYVTDQFNHRIRRIDPYGTVSTLAGTGTAGFNGNCGDATTSQVNSPNDIEVTSAGGIYFTDNLNHRVRRIMEMVSIAGSTSLSVDSTITLVGTPVGGLWSSANSSVAAAGSSSGIISGIASGTSSISYTVSGCSAATVVSVASGCSVSGDLSLCESGTSTLITGISGGTWASGNLAVASVGSATGIVFAVAPGTATIIYSAAGCTTSAVVTVTGAPASITGSLSLCSGATSALSATPLGGTWTSSNSAVATVSSAGVVSGVSAGTSIISYSVAGSCIGLAYVTVNASPTAISGEGSICAGGSTTLSGAPSGGTWSGGNMSIAVVGSSTGVVTSVAAGTVGITYTLSGCSITTVVTVSTSPGAISGTTAVCVGSSVTLTNAASGGTWVSGNTARATVGSTTGIVTGIASGTVRISYRISSVCYVTTIVTVATVGNITGALECLSATTTLTCTPSGGSWSSGATSIATIASSSGTAVALATGTVVITYTSPAGCVRTRTFTVSVTPSAITGGTDTMCTGTSTTLSEAASGGHWLSGNTTLATVDSSTGLVSAVGDGTVSISYVMPGGCSVQKSIRTIATPDGSYTIGGQYSTRVGQGYYMSLVSGVTEATWLSGSWSVSDTAVANITATYPARILGTGLSAGTTTFSFSAANSCGAHLYTREMLVYPYDCDEVWNVVGYDKHTTADEKITSGSFSAAQLSSSVAIDKNNNPIALFQNHTDYSVILQQFDGNSFVNVPQPTQTDYGGGQPSLFDPPVLGVDTSGALMFAAAGYWSAILEKSNGAYYEIVASHTGLSGTSTRYARTFDRHSNLFAVYRDWYNDYRGTAVSYNGSVWDTIGAPGFTSRSMVLPGVAVAYDGTRYMAYTYANDGDDRQHACVMKFNGASWVQIGDTLTDVGQISIQADLNGIPYILYTDISTTPSTGISPLYLRRFDGSSWSVVGGVPVSSAHVEYPAMSISYDGTPYVVYKDFANDGKTTVRKFSAGTWSAVGTPGFTAEAEGQSIVVNTDGTVYVACWETFGAMWKFAGTSWEKMNGSRTVSNDMPGGVPVIAVDADTPYVGFISEAGTALVRKLVDSNWVTVGGAGFSTTASSLSIAVNSGVVYAGYVDASVGNKATVMRYAGGAWSALGGTGISAGSCLLTDIALGGDGNPYIVYRDATNSNKATVLKYNGSSWSAVGTPGFSPGAASALAITVADTIPYVSFSDAANGDRVTVMKFDGTSWASVGAPGFSLPPSIISPSSFVGIAVNLTDIAVDSSGTPYVAFAGYYAHVLKFNGSSWQPLESGPVSEYVSGAYIDQLSLAVTRAGVPYLFCQNGYGSSSGLRFGAFTFDGYAWRIVGVDDFPQSSDILDGTAYNGAIALNSDGVPYLVHSYIFLDGAYSFFFGDRRFRVRKLGANTISGSLTLCQGGRSYLLSEREVYNAPGEVDHGTWSSSNVSVATVDTFGSVYGVAPGTATISFSYAGCPTTVVVTVNAPVSAGTLSGSSSVAAGSSITLSSTVSGGIWSSSSVANATVGSSSGSVTGVAPGTVTITYAVAGACGLAVATRTVNVTSARPAVPGGTGVDGTFFSAYPNPTSASISIESGTTGTLSVYTIDGKEVQQYDVIKGATVIRLPSGLAAGIYMLRFKADDGSTHTLRLVYEP